MMTIKSFTHTKIASSMKHKELEDFRKQKRAEDLGEGICPLQLTYNLNPSLIHQKETAQIGSAPELSPLLLTF